MSKLLSIEFIASTVIAIVIVVLDKAGKLNTPLLTLLVCIAAALSLHPVLNLPWVVHAPTFSWRLWRSGLVAATVLLVFSALAIWIRGGKGEVDTAERAKAVVPQIEHSGAQTNTTDSREEIREAVREAFVELKPPQGETPGIRDSATVKVTRARPQEAQKEVPPEIRNVQTAAVSVLNRLYNSYKTCREDVQRLDALGKGGGLGSKRFELFLQKYNRDYREEVRNTRALLMGHVRHVPHLSVEDEYPIDPLGPAEIEQQIADLKALLNEMEAEQGLPLSCSDVRVFFGTNAVRDVSLGRKLSDAEITILHNTLWVARGSSVVIHPTSEADSQAFAITLMSVFQDAGWKSELWPAAQMEMSVIATDTGKIDLTTGIHCVSSSTGDQSVKLAREALQGAGIQCNWIDADPTFLVYRGPASSRAGQPVPPVRLLIIVGKQPRIS